MRWISIAALALLAACAPHQQQDWGQATTWNRSYGYGYPHEGYQQPYVRRVPVTPTTRPYWGTWGY